MLGWLAVATLITAQARAPVVPARALDGDAVAQPEPRVEALVPANPSAATDPRSVPAAAQTSPTQSGAGHLVLLGGFHGFFSGLAVPGALSEHPRDGQRSIGMAAGFAVGTLGALVSAQFVDVSASGATGLILVDGLGSIGALGAGFLAAQSDDSTAINTAYLIGGGLSLAIGSQVASDLQLGGGDLTLMFLSSVFGAWNGYTLSLAAAGNTRQVAGSTLLAMGAFGLGGIFAGAHTELRTAEVYAAASGGLWGAWLSTLALSLAKEHPRGHVLIVLGATDAGLALTSLLLGNGVQPQQLGIVSLAGVGGMFLGAVVAPQLSSNGDLGLGTLLGTGIGLAGGALIAATVGSDTAPPAPSGDAAPGRGPSLSFRGIASQPVIGRDGRMDGVALGVVIQND